MLEEIKAGSIIDVSANWTKGQILQYIVVFADPGTSFMNAIRIMNYSDAVSTGAHIPEINSRAYANVFSGFHTICVTDVMRVVTSVSKETYNRITSAIFAVMNGQYSRTSSGFYRVDKKSFNYADIFLALNGVRIPAVQEEPIIEADADTIEKDQIGNTIDNESKDMIFENMVKEYELTKSEDQRVDYLFDKVAVDGMLNVQNAFNIFIMHKNTTRDGNKKSLLVSKAEFMMFVKTMNYVVLNSDIQLYNKAGERVTPGRDRINRLGTQCKALYYGYTKEKRVRKDLSDDEIMALIEEYRSGDETKTSFCKKHNLALSTFSTWIRNKSESEKKKYDISTVAKGMISDKNLSNCLPEEAREIRNAILYIIANIDKIVSIGDGKDKSYTGNKNILIACAKKLCHGRFSYKIAFDIPDIIMKLSGNVIKAIFCAADNYTKEITRQKLYLISVVVQNKDEFNWSICPGDIVKKKDHIYTCLDCLLTSVVTAKKYRDVQSMLTSRGIIMELRTIVKVPDSYFTYYFNKNKLEKSA